MSLNKLKKSKIINEFTRFSVRGNVLDMAVGIVIGAAFGKIVSSLVSDILMPPIGMLLGGVDFTDLFIDLSGKGYRSLALAQEAGAPTINYGKFINTGLDFIIIAFAIFMLVKVANTLKKEEKKPKEIPQQEKLLEEIRDLLKDNR